MVGGRYRILTQVGIGGMSTVYLAMDASLNRRWAVKQMRDAGSAERRDVMLRSLTVESEMIARLDHPAIPRIVDLIDDDTGVFVVMDFVEGQTLRTLLEREGPQDEALVVDWGIQLCDVLDYLHRRTPMVVFRDMKPSNVMLTPDGMVKLIDFGIAIEQGETFYLLSIIFGAVGSVLIFLLGPLTISLYRVSSETIQITRQLMNAYVVIIFFQAVQSVMTKGVLRGGGDTKFLMKADILFMWLVSIPLGIASGLIFGWPAWLTMLCLRADYGIKSVWCVSRLMSGKWIHEADGLREIKSL